MKAVDARIPIILVTGHGTTDLAIEAMKRGAFDYLLKPLRYDQLKEVVDRACASSRLMTVPAVVADAEPVPDRADVLIGRCEAMQAVYKAVGRVASTDTTVLILGESGTGKELVARAVYQHSKRADRPFLAINCGAIPGTTHRERTVRAREGRVHRRGPEANRQVRAVPRRHHLPR